ncbi:hypothetical protein ABMA27_002191 [Loxostege sticticalis]|uniref:Odorant receptor n=1 Tax=Loxostege sticticalis TaxID=481309 RepID=A0ABR3HWW8_LOXSC
MPEKSYGTVKSNLREELNYINSMGSKIFLYPFSGRSKLVDICYLFVCFLVVVTATQLLTALLVTDLKEWIEIVNVAPNLGVVLMTLLKYTKVHNNQHVYKKIFKHFSDDLWDVVFDSYDHKKIVIRYTAIAKYATRFLFYYSVPLVVFVDSFPRIIMYLENEIIGNENPQYLYPFDGWYPFDKVNWYYTAYLWESFMTFIVVCVYAFSNMIHASYTSFICMELEILGVSIKDLITPDDVTNITNHLKVQEIHSHIKRKLKTIIRRHQFLAQLASELNIVLGDMMLLNYIFGSVFITLTIFTATVVDNMYKSLRYFFMFCSLIVEIFFNCMIGQVLSNHSEQLTDAIYSADWPFADNETKVMLLILMRRTQKPFEYTANGYLAMNLNSFSGVCSMSYQLFNLIRTAYSK